MKRYLVVIESYTAAQKQPNGGYKFRNYRKDEVQLLGIIASRTCAIERAKLENAAGRYAVISIRDLSRATKNNKGEWFDAPTTAAWSRSIRAFPPRVLHCAPDGSLTLPSGAVVRVDGTGIDPTIYPAAVVKEFDGIDTVILPDGTEVS